MKAPKHFFSVFLIIMGMLYLKSTCASVDQILNDYLYQNPAELNLVNHVQLIGGNIYKIPAFEFQGTTRLGSGRVTSRTNNSLPYVLTAYRFTDRVVLGFNITPSGYGHIRWPIDSIVSYNTTSSNDLFYRIGPQGSYQLTHRLALGVGVNAVYNKTNEISFVVPGRGNQMNRISGVNPTADLGLVYQINRYHAFVATIYTAVNSYGHGTSTLGDITIQDYSSNIIQAAVAYLGLQHHINEKWFLEEKIYWSGWGIQKNVNFINSATGTFIVPTNWKDVWSFQVTTRYAFIERCALLASVIYETDPASIKTNLIGGPISNVGSIAGGLDILLKPSTSVQVLYSYGTFLSPSKVNRFGVVGSVSIQSQTFALQFIYKT